MKKNAAAQKITQVFHGILKFRSLGNYGNYNEKTFLRWETILRK